MIELSTSPLIRAYNMDCMDFMKDLPDNYYDLAIVDPPYGIGCDNTLQIEKPDRPSTWGGVDKYIEKKWDSITPKSAFFSSLHMISKNQVVWGGNYFTDYLKPSKAWIFWDKMFDKTFNFSHGELAWTSFDKQLLKHTQSSKSETRGGKDRIHPTQKPVKLYRWLLKNYAKEGDKILDTHGGSMSIAIACHMEGFDLDIIELDEDYFNDAVKRFKLNTVQGRLF